MAVQGERLNDGLSVLTVGTGPPLVEIPGLGEGMDLSVRGPRLPLLSARLQAAATGRTVHLIARPVDPPPDTTISTLASAYATAIEDRFDDPVDVFGASAGGVTGLQLALDHPGVVRRLVVVMAASRLGEEGRRRLRDNVAYDGKRVQAAWTGSRLMTHGPLRAVVLAGMLSAESSPRAAGELAIVEDGQSWDITDRLGEITAPTLLVAGTRDRLFTVELVQTTACGIPDARLVLLPGRGHLTALFDRRGSQAVAAFLAEGQHVETQLGERGPTVPISRSPPAGNGVVHEDESGGLGHSVHGRVRGGGDTGSPPDVEQRVSQDRGRRFGPGQHRGRH